MVDYSDLFDIESRVVKIGKHEIKVSALSTADVKAAQKAVELKQIVDSDAELYLTWLSIKRNHPEITWKSFSTEWAVKYTTLLMAEVIDLNGFREIQSKLIG